MNKAVLATLCFVAGATFGFTVGYCLNKEKQYVEPIPVNKPKEEPKEEKPQEVNLEIKPARLARKSGDVGINYTAYVKELQYKQETQSPPDDDPEDDNDNDTPDEDIDMEDFKETYEERLERENNEVIEHSERYKREHKGKIELMTSDEWDTDFSETDYEREDLYYFTEDNILTDEDGHELNELETIGPKVRQVGWMRSPEENIYVRNHPQEKEYRVFKEHCSVKEWF